MEILFTDLAPKAVGPYSQAITANGFIFCAGQIGINPQTGELVDGLENQVNQIMANIKAVLQAGNSDLEHIVKTTIFVQNMDQYAKINEIYGSYFTNHKPARSTIEVSKLPKNALVEIEAIAAIK